MSSTPSPTRQKILNATCQLLEAGDGKAARMSDIAKAAGISRQALYLHFKTRGELLVAATRHLEDQLDMPARLAPSRAAKNGRDRIAAYIRAWAEWMPEVRNFVSTLLAMAESDPDAAAALKDRMSALHHGCTAAIRALEADGALLAHWDVESGADMLWAMVSFGNWRSLTEEKGWSQEVYIAHMTEAALLTFTGKGTGE
ncbi:MAG: TetR/AcrR family transcriptional regulator [Mangrovicoccus sp.]